MCRGHEAPDAVTRLTGSVEPMDCVYGSERGFPLQLHEPQPESGHTERGWDRMSTLFREVTA